MFSLGLQAGLFSAVASAFIINVQPQLQPGTGEETVTLFRILIKTNNAFGNDAPILQQQDGPPHSIVQVQAILYATLAVSLLSALLAMLGKQWLNRYESTDMRGTAVDRSQNRQRKLDGIIKWYFYHVMEFPPMMLQAALLLLSCALSRYLWEINITIASVVLGVTSFGFIPYIFIVVAGAVYDDCPYQTPGSRILLCTLYALRSTLSVIKHFSSKLPRYIQRSWCFQLPAAWWTRMRLIVSWLLSRILSLLGLQPLPRISPLAPPILHSITRSLPHILSAYVYSTLVPSCILVVPPLMFIGLIADACLLGWRIFQLLVGYCGTVPHLLMGTPPQTIALDLRCISWILHTSLDKADHLSALEYFATMTELTSLPPTLVADCFNAFIGCVAADVDNHGVVVVRGSEPLATVAAKSFLRTFNHPSAMDQSSSVLADIRQRYNRTFSFETDFRHLPFYYTMVKIHHSVNQTCDPRHVQWHDYKPSPQEHIPVAQDVAEGALVEYQETQRRKVPRWILRFALRSLLLDPLPPIVADCLSIIATDLGCDVSDARFTTSDERCVHIMQMTIILTSK